MISLVRFSRWLVKSAPRSRPPKCKKFHKSGVDHADHDTTSIVKLIEERFRLAPLGTRDANVISLRTALEEAGLRD
jgi:hypothetical protein